MTDWHMTTATIGRSRLRGGDANLAWETLQQLKQAVKAGDKQEVEAQADELARLSPALLDIVRRELRMAGFETERVHREHRPGRFNWGVVVV